MAPFKFRFSKSKSRSKDSRSSSTECDEVADLQASQDESCSQPETPRTELNALTNGNTLQNRFPQSPPPSYERVLQETRSRQSTSLDATESIEENNEDEENLESINEVSNAMENNESSRKIIIAPQIIHKSSKELYKAVAKQWGITCKMSDHCRCFDCQSHYFDSTYGKSDPQPDGGLGAGAPMFIAEVMHGTACTIL